MKKGQYTRREERTCIECGNKFWFNLCYAKRAWNTGRYCSHKCRIVNKLPKTKKQAQSFISNQVRDGKIPPAKELVCVDCGASAHDYDHYLGYENEHYKDVQPVCVSCHKSRGVKRG